MKFIQTRRRIVPMHRVERVSFVRDDHWTVVLHDLDGSEHEVNRSTVEAYSSAFVAAAPGEEVTVLYVHDYDDDEEITVEVQRQRVVAWQIEFHGEPEARAVLTDNNTNANILYPQPDGRFVLPAEGDFKSVEAAAAYLKADAVAQREARKESKAKAEAPK